VYYAPVGVQYGRQAADSDLNLYAKTLTRKWRETIELSLFTRARWAGNFLKAATEEVHKAMDRANWVDERSGHGLKREVKDMSVGSSWSHPSEEGLSKQVEIIYPWEAFGKDDKQMYDTAVSVDAQLKAFNDIRAVVLQGYKEIKEAKATSQLRIEMAVADQLGDFAPFLNLHGSFAKAIEEIVRPVMAPSVKEGAQLRTDVEKAFSQVATEV
jgi:hypothetical protein